MTAKEKAERLITSYYNLIKGTSPELEHETIYSLAKESAIISVDETLNMLFDHGTNEINAYWFDVDEELKNL